MPSISMKPLVPSNPGPPKDPNSFWAPWPAIRDPCAKRTISGGGSFTLEPLDLAGFTVAPSAASSGPGRPAPPAGHPCARRTIGGGVSSPLEPLDLAVFTFAPSVASSGIINPARGWGGPLAQAVYPRRFGYTPDPHFLPLFTGVRGRAILRISS